MKPCDPTKPGGNTPSKTEPLSHASTYTVIVSNVFAPPSRAGFCVAWVQGGGGRWGFRRVEV